MTPERITLIEATIQTHGRRLADGDEAIQQIKQDLAENTEATKRIDAATADLADLVEFFTSMKGAFKVLNWIGKLARPIGAIVGLGVAVWAAWLAWRAGVQK